MNKKAPIDKNICFEFLFEFIGAAARPHCDEAAGANREVVKLKLLSVVVSTT